MGKFLRPRGMQHSKGGLGWICLAVTWGGGDPGSMWPWDQAEDEMHTGPLGTEDTGWGVVREV